MTEDQPDELTRLWDDQPEMIREFLERRPRYERLCGEVQYILETELLSAEIEYAAVVSRAKALPKFAEKIARKRYANPLRDVTDLAGVRVVYLYRADQPTIEKIIADEFRVIERVDKVGVREANAFGYGALHYLVKLGKGSSGARYDELKNLVCEIQIRTVLQDAWAIIDHHLSYKQPTDIPRELRRDLSALAAIVENADGQFDRLRTEREKYIESVKRRRTDPTDFLSQEVNLDTFGEYLKWKFPEKQHLGVEPTLLKSLRGAQREGIEHLTELDALVERTKVARVAINRANKAGNAVTEVNRALALVSKRYRAQANYGETALERFRKYEHLVAKP